MIQMQKISYILIKHFPEIQLLVIQETKYTTPRTICKDGGNSMTFNIMLMVQYILPWVIHYLQLRNNYKWMIIIIQCGIKDKY